MNGVCDWRCRYSSSEVVKNTRRLPRDLTHLLDWNAHLSDVSTTSNNGQHPQGNVKWISKSLALFWPRSPKSQMMPRDSEKYSRAAWYIHEYFKNTCSSGPSCEDCWPWHWSEMWLGKPCSDIWAPSFPKPDHGKKIYPCLPEIFNTDKGSE